MDTTYWAAWPGPPAPSTDRSAQNDFFQLATRPMFELWDNEPLTAGVRAHASPEQIRLFAAYVADGDITNGGFTQWGYNSYSCLCPCTLEGFRLLGLVEAAELLEAAASALFPGGDVPPDRDVRAAVEDRSLASPRVSAQIDRLEEQYFALPTSALSDDPDLVAVACTWIDGHPDRFFTSTPG